MSTSVEVGVDTGLITSLYMNMHAKNFFVEALMGKKIRCSKQRANI